MNDKSKILSDLEINQITEILEDNKTASSELYEKIISDDENFQEESFTGIEENTEDKPYPYNTINKNITTGDKYVEVDIKTGREIDVNAKDINPTTIIEEAFSKSTVKMDNGLNTLKDYGLNDEDSMQLFNIIVRFKNGEKFNIYHELPKGIQTIVRQLNGPNMSTINATTKDLLNHFIRDMGVDKEFVDLQESLQHELKLNNLSEMYNNELKNHMEVDLLDKANKLDEQGENEKAKLLRKISATFVDSYTFKTIQDALKNNDLIRRRINKDLSRYKRFVHSFIYKYQDSKFRINDIRILEKILPDILDVSLDDIKKFIIVICKVCEGMDPDNVVEHTFMYYTIQNMILLKYIDKESSFGNDIRNNLLNTINIMKEVE